MGKIILIAAALAAWAIPATAQTTACGWVNGQWICNTYPGVQAQPQQPPAQVNWGLLNTNPQAAQERNYEYQRQRDQSARANAEATAQAQRDAIIDQRIQDFGATSRSVAALMDAGECREATMQALRGGSEALAQIVQTECKPK